MLDISDKLAARLNSQDPHYKLQVLLYVRTWNGSAYEFAAAQDITAYLKTVSPISWKLDKEGYNEWRFSNATLTFDNSKQKFKQGLTSGFFGTDKIIFGSKIQIKAGAVDYLGATDTEYIYTGFVYQDPVYRPDEKTVDIAIRGHLSDFETYTAETISTLVEEEVIGSDSGTEFTVANNASALLTELKKGATPATATVLLPSEDFSVSQENSHDLPLKVTLEQALVPGENLYATYRYWRTDQTIEAVVGEICDTVGIAEADRKIAPAVFATDAESTFSQTDKAGFDLGTFSGTKIDDGDDGVTLAETFLGDNLISPTWAIVSGSPIDFTFASLDATSIVQARSGIAASAKTPSATATGTWAFYLVRGQPITDFHFVSDTGDPSTSNGYALRVSATAAGGNIFLYLYRYDSGTPTVIWTSRIEDRTDYATEFKISRDSDGNINIFVRYWKENTEQWYETLKVLKAATDTTHNTAGFITVAFNAVASGLMQMYGISEAALVQTDYGGHYPEATYTTPAIDGTSSLTKWGKIYSSISNPDGTSSYVEYAESDDDVTYSDFARVESTGNLPATKRYVKLRWHAFTSVNNTPMLVEWSLRYYTTTVTIPVVNLTGLNCYTTLVKLAEMVSYEIGFDGSDIFFFRPRNSTVSSIGTLTEKNVASIDYASDGLDRIYNRVNVQYGDYTKTVDSDTEAEAQPNSLKKYGLKEYTISSSQLLPAAHVNIAVAVAPTVYAFTKDLRRRATLTTKFFVQYELGDRLTVNIPDNIFKLWKWGDTSVAFGDTDIVYYNVAFLGQVFSLYGVDMRIEGIEFDLENWQVKYDLVEEIS
jgi:hypothetical protein